MSVVVSARLSIKNPNITLLQEVLDELAAEHNWEIKVKSKNPFQAVIMPMDIPMDITIARERDGLKITVDTDNQVYDPALRRKIGEIKRYVNDIQAKITQRYVYKGLKRVLANRRYQVREEKSGETIRIYLQKENMASGGRYA